MIKGAVKDKMFLPWTFRIDPSKEASEDQQRVYFQPLEITIRRKGRRCEQIGSQFRDTFLEPKRLKKPSGSVKGKRWGWAATCKKPSPWGESGEERESITGFLHMLRV